MPSTWSLLALLFACPTPTEDPVFEFPELELTITLPALDELESGEPEADAESPVRRWWNAKLGEKRFGLSLATFDAQEWSLREPGDVTELVVDHQRRERRFDVIEQDFLQGRFGYAPFASLVVANVTAEGQTAPSERHFVLGGLLQASGYVLHALCEPLPTEDEEARIRDLLAGAVAYVGKAERNPEWTDEEVVARWTASTPDSMHGDFVKAMQRASSAKKVCIRTDHYLIMTNSSGGKLFAKKMEENYDEIAKTFPFVAVEGRRLLPVFLFRTQDEYIEFDMFMTGSSAEQASMSGGHAWRDYYATWYEAPKDPVHIHEQTHQIFANRLRLGGGGSWFQEGVAEYIETRPNDRNIVARLVSDGEGTPLRELVLLPSLLYSTEEDTRGGSRAGDNYKQAALLIEFLRESDFGKQRFEDFLYTLGKVSRNDEAEIEAGFQKVYGVGIDRVAAEWRAYCEDR